MKSEREFWNWFIQHEPELFEFDPHDEANRERIFDELLGELQKVHPALVFEFGPNAARREFVISADGMKRAFPAVVSLAKAAPHLDRWEVIPFRPRRVPNVVELGGKRVDPNDVEFSLLDNGRNVGIYLFIPGFKQSDVDLKRIGYLLLDEALGEYDVESKLGLIRILSRDTRTDGGRYPFARLPGLFDQLVGQLEGRSGRSS